MEQQRAKNKHGWPHASPLLRSFHSCPDTRTLQKQVGFVVEVSEDRVSEVVEAYKAGGVEAVDIGRVTDDGKVCYAVAPPAPAPAPATC